jgi:sugar lactone lactonase YvrE
MTEITCVLDAKAAIGENPVWSIEERVLYWLDTTQRAIHRFDPQSGVNQTWRMPDLVCSFALREDRGLIVALGAGVYLVDLETMSLDAIAGEVTDKTQTRLNDGRCDRAGRFWVGGMDLEKHRRIASLYRVDPDHSIHKVVDELIVSNGLAWSPDSRTMYHSDSRQNVIWAYNYDLKTGIPSNRRVFATTNPEEGLPDGAAVDAEGFYWSAGVRGGRVTRYAPDGSVDTVIKLPISLPSMCAFGGDNLDILYVTSAREFLSESKLSEEPLAGGVFAIDVGVRGLPEPRFRG